MVENRSFRASWLLGTIGEDWNYCDRAYDILLSAVPAGRAGLYADSFVVRRRRYERADVLGIVGRALVLNGTVLPRQTLLPSRRCRAVWATTLLGYRDTLHDVIELVRREDQVLRPRRAPAQVAELL